MANFDHLKARDIAGRTVWLSVPQVTDNARLKLRPATDVNQAYQNGLLRLSASRLRKTASRGLKQLDIEQSREDDRKLYAQFVVDDWEGIEDADGNSVPFSREEAEAFFAMLPAWIFDRIRIFAMTPENFLPSGEQPIDVQALSGNSGSGSAGS